MTTANQGQESGMTSGLSARVRWLLVGMVIEATIPGGTALVASLERTISTETANVGEPVELRTPEPITLGEGTVLPAGVALKGEVTHAQGGGRIAGAPELTLRFTRLELDGEDYQIAAEPFRLRGKSEAKESAIQIGGGTVAGAVVGAITGNAVRGAVVGAVLGTGVAVATEGDDIVLPAGQKLRIRLVEPLTVRFRPPPAET
jgi:hypothetical protein